MIRSDKECRHSKEQLSELEVELKKHSPVRRSAAGGEVASAVIDALRMQIGDLEREISAYEDLKEGRLLSFGAENLDSLGELLAKARIARGLTQAQLGELLACLLSRSVADRPRRWTSETERGRIDRHGSFGPISTRLSGVVLPLLRSTRRRPLRTCRRHPHRGLGPLATSPELGGRPPARLG
jgi:hypothetical protein